MIPMETCLRCGRPIHGAQFEIDGQPIHSTCRTYEDAWHVKRRSPEVVRLRAAGAVLLRHIYESGIAYDNPEVEAALAVFANRA